MNPTQKNSFRWRWLLVPAALAAFLILLRIGIYYIIILESRKPAVEYDPGIWYELAPEGAVTGAGEPLTTRIRFGSENKIIVFFYGGGISINDYMAARPYIGLGIDREIGFYTDTTEGQIPDYCELGITSTQGDNPFRDWSVIIIPYTTGDFHIGTGEYEYTDMDGAESVLYHHGYLNYQAIMDEAVAYTGSSPEELIIAGWSAGGYGAVLLADDLLENYFPQAGHITLCVDSSLLIFHNWPEIARDVWGAPKEIVAKMRTDNLVVDFFTALYNKYGDSISYLYIGSVRDGALAKYQTYFDTGVYSANNSNVWVYTSYLQVMVNRLLDRIPGIGIYLFDRLPYSWNPLMNRLTQHTVLETQSAYWRLSGGRSVIQWLNDAVNGEVKTIGLEKIDLRGR